MQRGCTNVYVVLHMRPGTANADFFWLVIVAKLTGEYGNLISVNPQQYQIVIPAQAGIQGEYKGAWL